MPAMLSSGAIKPNLWHWEQIKGLVLDLSVNTLSYALHNNNLHK